MYATERDKRVTTLKREVERVDVLTKRARAIDTGAARVTAGKADDAANRSASSPGVADAPVVGTAQA